VARFADPGQHDLAGMPDEELHRMDQFAAEAASHCCGSVNGIETSIFGRAAP
jgi:hypothetical protein